MLKNAKDACATEALEIATYTALERLARAVGDDETAEAGRVDPRRRGEDARARPARDPQADRRRRRADVKGDPSYDITTTGAADAVREAGARPRRPRARPRPRPSAPPARPARSRASRRPRVRSRAPSPARSDLAIAALRLAHRRGDHRQAARALADRPRQDRLLRAQAREPHHGPQPHHLAARRRAVGRATTSSPSPRSRPCSPRATTSAPSTVRAYERAHKNRAGVSRPPSARSPTPNARRCRGRESRGTGSKRPARSRSGVRVTESSSARRQTLVLQKVVLGLGTVDQLVETTEENSGC